MKIRWRRALATAPLVLAALTAACEEAAPPDGGGEMCATYAGIGPSPLRRLSRTEYLNTVRDLFAPLAIPTLEIVPDKPVAGFENNEQTQTVVPDLVASYYDASTAVSDVVKDNAASFAGCTYGSDAEAKSCAKQVVAAFGRRAYRRPLTAAETSTFETFLSDNAAEHGFETALGMFVQALLLSPNFLYRPEFGVEDPSAEEGAPLGGYELASRLSYFLWQSMPDDTLFAAAESGALSTPEGIRAEAERLMGDPRARDAVADFHRQWLSLDEMNEMYRDPGLFPAWDNQATPPALREATAHYLDHVFWDGEGTLSELLTSPKAFVNDTVAPLYGVDPPGTDTFVLVDLNPKERSGFLTHAGPMAAMAHETMDAPILRGVFVLRKMLCASLGAPPKDVPDIAPVTPEDVPMTTRDRIEQSHTGPSCKGCHDSINPLGFAFNNYDATGAWRTEENGLPIDATGDHPETGAFESAVDLSASLAESDLVKACVVKQWFRFAMGRLETKSGDLCELEQLTTSFDEGGGSMRDLLLDIVTSDSFRYRSPMGGAQ